MSEKKIRVLFVLIEFDAGGSERVVLDLASNLDPEKFEIYVAAFRGGVLESSFREVCKEVFIIAKKPGLDIGAMLQLSNIIKSHFIDVVNTHHYMPCFYSFLGCCVLERKRLIYTEHSVPEVVGIAKGKHRIILNFMLRRIDTVIGVSREIVDTFTKHYPKHEQKFRIVLNGVDIDKFRCPENRVSTRKQFCFEPEHFVVGTVANFRKVKNHACLIRAASRLKKKVPQLRLLLVGTGFPGDPENTEDDIKKMVRDLGVQDHVVFAGYQSDIPRMLSALDCFCLPSFSEGLPVSVLEAMTADLVVVGSNVSGISEVVEENVTGFLFPSDADDELSKIIRLLYNKNYSVDLFNKRIRSNVTAKYSKEIWLQNITNIFSAS